MAWSDNVRCLHCDGKLPLYRKITSGQFCSAVHRKAYWQDQERLAVERLHQTHDSLRAYRSPEALEAILGKPAASEPVGVDKYYLANQPLDVESKLSVEEIARSASNTGNVKFPGFLTEEKPALRAWNALLAAWDVEFAHWPMSAPSLPSCSSEREESTLPTANGMAVPLFEAYGVAARLRAAAVNTAPVPFIAKLSAQVPFAVAPQTEELSRAFLDSLQAAEIAAEAVLEPVLEAEPLVEEPPLPLADQMAALPKISIQSALFGLRGSAPEPQQTVWKSQDLRCDASFASPAVAAIAQLEPLALTNAPQALAAHAGAAGDAKAGDLQGYAQPMELRAATGAPSMNFAVAASALEMQLAPASSDSILNGRAAPANLTHAGAAGDVKAGDLQGYAQPMELKAATGAPSMNFAAATSALEMQLAPANCDSILNGQAAPTKRNVATAPSAPLELRSETTSPALQLASQTLELSLRPAPGCRYDVQSQPGSSQLAAAARSAAADVFSNAPAPVKELATQSLELSLGIAGHCELPVPISAGTKLPAVSADVLAVHNDLRIVVLPNALGKTTLNPPLAGIRPLAFAGTPCAPSAPRPETGGVALLYTASAPMNPVGKWEPLDGSATPVRHGFLAAFSGSQGGKHAWTNAVDFWQHAPRDLKLLAIAIPILLGLALRPSLPKVRVTAPASTGDISRNLGDGFRAQFVNVRNSVAQRAAVSLNEDFRSGLDDWQTRGDLSTGWSFDENGFVKPKTLALYRPSLGLRDYDMEFLGLIDKKALSWVVRARDFDNYYVVKLVVTKTGPLPTMGITRYAVIDGKAQASVETVAAINARPDMLYRVTMHVHDDTFLLSLQDTVVDNWTETRLKSGGVGFFAAHGEESRLRWLQITHQYDMLGRLCAYLAPYNIPTTNGSW